MGTIVPGGIKNSYKFIMVYQYKTLTKNFNQGINSGELVWKMAKSKHQKQH